MTTKLELVNRTLHLCGEQSLANSNGTLGSITKGCIQSALQQVVQMSRSKQFEMIQTFTVTNSDWTVNESNLSSNTLQIMRVRYFDGINWYPLSQQEYDGLPWNIGYSIVSGNIYVSPLLARPQKIDVLTIVVPQLSGFGDNDTLPFGDLIVPSVIHTAASILLLSYLDDANSAAAQQKIAESFISYLKQQTGMTYGRLLSFRGINT